MQNDVLEPLIDAILEFDALSARQWIADSGRQRMDWSQLPKPASTSTLRLAVAAGIVELMAERSGQTPPYWTSDIGAVERETFLVRSALSMPHLRRLCREEGPAPLRRRNLFAPPGFLTIA